MDYAEERILKLGGNSISLGMVYKNKVLYEWYKTLGYEIVKVKKDIAFMKKDLDERI